MAGNRNSGRRPKPSAILELYGNRGKRRLNDREPKPPKAIPIPPAELNEAARGEWRRVCQMLYDLGIVSAIDRAVVTAYCECWSTYMDAIKQVKISGGPVVKSGTGTPIQNPWINVKNRARHDLLNFARDLGMTPAARSRVRTDELPKFDRPGQAETSDDESEFYDRQPENDR